MKFRVFIYNILDGEVDYKDVDTLENLRWQFAWYIDILSIETLDGEK